jgi:8-oxo-dGTP pyrophosphatase MutT (NUDIX family)
MLQKRPNSYWGFFGGTKRKGETNLECAKREFEEETGIKPPAKLKRLLTYKRQCIIYYYFSNKKIKRIKNNKETSSFKWYALKELPKIKLLKDLKPYYSSLVKRLKKIIDNPHP